MKQKINCNWHRYVDLCLPSGLLWATCNIGAKEPWENGLYFSWGNVDGHEKESGYDFGTSNDGVYASTPGGELATDIPVNAKYDAARANFGGSWRVPTTAEFWELRDNCTSEWTMQNGITGMMFVSRINGNSVFFPATSYFYGTTLSLEGVCGRYWSSSLHSYTYYSYGLSFGSIYVNPQSYVYPYLGFTVRAVLDHPKDSLMIKTIKR